MFCRDIDSRHRDWDLCRDYRHRRSRQGRRSDIPAVDGPPADASQTKPARSRNSRLAIGCTPTWAAVSHEGRPVDPAADQSVDQVVLDQAEPTPERALECVSEHRNRLGGVGCDCVIRYEGELETDRHAESPFC